MVPSTSTSASPTTVLKDAVTNFLQTANHALALAEESGKAELSLALQNEREAHRERDELRHERDLLIQEKLGSLVELESAKREVDRWKAASEKAEWMIDHQAETISQLRKEAQQWKDQFMRIEEERSRLSIRVDELVAQQLYTNRRDIYNQEPLTPRSQASRSNRGASTSQQYFANASTSVSEPNGYTPDEEVSGRLSRLSTGRPPQSQVSSSSTVVSRKKPLRAAGHQAGSSTQPTAYAQPQAQAVPVRSSTKQTVVRRVHAVVEVPVKEESVDSQNILPDDKGGSRSQSIEVEDARASVSYLDDAEEERQHIHQSASSRRPARAEGRIYKKSNGGRRYEERSTSDGEDDAKHSHLDDEDEDEEDELMLGFEDNRSELYDSERIAEERASSLQTPPPPRRAQTQVQTGKHSGSTGKKRNSPYPAASSKKARRR